MKRFPKAILVRQLLDFFAGDFRRIKHAISVLNHTEEIARSKDGYDPDILIAAALFHDVGIKVSEKLFGYNNGHTQEKYGPPEAERLLKEVEFPEGKLKKVCEIIGNHHSPSRYDYIELEILKEADRIVNKNESKMVDAV